MISDGGTFRVPVTINDELTLKFVIDSGAADVSVPADVVMTLVFAQVPSRTPISLASKPTSWQTALPFLRSSS